MRVFFTGGSGKAGRHAVAHLRAAGHRVLNADMAAGRSPGGDELRVDLTDMGQVLDAMAGMAGFDDLEEGGRRGFDAVVHFAATPCILIESDVECFRTNTLSTYNVLSAAVSLGIRKIVFASSETTYGICFGQGEVKPAYIPVDEEHPTVPQDSYAMSKVCNEVCARSFQARSGADIYGLRINNVMEPEDYLTLFPGFLADPATRRRNIFGYIDARDLGHMVERCLLTDGLGYQVFNVANPDTSVALPSAEVAERFYAGVPRKAEVGGHETFYSIEKARRLLGFAPRHGWRDLPGLDGRAGSA